MITTDPLIFSRYNIRQVYISDALDIFKSRFMKTYNLVGYRDIKSVSMFFGMYNKKDFDVLFKHQGDKYILWGGTDCNDNYSVRKENLEMISKYKNIKHFSISKNIQERLSKYNIKSEYIYINMVNTDIFFPRKQKGDKIYIYNGHKKGNEYLYGKNIYTQIMNLLPQFQYILSNTLNKSYEKMGDVYSECFIGLRLTDRDGNANTVQEFEAMNIPIVHNQSDYGLKWKRIHDIIKHINDHSIKRK